MRFTPLIFAGVAAAGMYWPEEPVKSSSAPAYVDPVKSSSSSAAYYHPKPTMSSSSSVSKDGYKPKKTSTIYSTSCWTETSSSVTKTWTSVKAIPTICDDEEEVDPVKPTSSSAAYVHPAKPSKEADAEMPYCSAYTETCTVTVTATGGAAPTKGADAYPTKGADAYPSKGADAYPVKPSAPAAPVYPTGGEVSPVKPSGTGSPVKPYPSQFTGAASAQKAGAFVAGAGAIAALLL